MASLAAGPDFSQLLQALQSDVSSVRKQAEARYDQLKASSPGPTLQVRERNVSGASGSARVVASTVVWTVAPAK
jgi:hypothetical protein